MLPTHGTVSSIALLAASLQHRSYRSIDDWVEATRNRSAFLASAIDHRPAADYLVRHGLVRALPEVTPTPRMRTVPPRNDRPSLVAIASLVLIISPPQWISVAVSHGRVHSEYIPTEDFRALRWLGADLARLLLAAAAAAVRPDDAIPRGVGRAAELVVLASLEEDGRRPIHVADISANYGYDIEATAPSVRRFEVKGATESTASTFHLTRNEYEKCRDFGDEWTVVQVVFSRNVTSTRRITASEILDIRELPSTEVLRLAPTDSGQFLWEVSARFTPPTGCWRPSLLRVPIGLELPSVRELAAQ